jgi:hypothetical protein
MVASSKNFMGGLSGDVRPLAARRKAQTAGGKESGQANDIRRAKHNSPGWPGLGFTQPAGRANKAVSERLERLEPLVCCQQQ